MKQIFLSALLMLTVVGHSPSAQATQAQSVQCLARVMYHEARERYRKMWDVGFVVMNRQALSPDKSVCQIANDRHQFSPKLRKPMKLPVTYHDMRAWEDAKRVANLLISRLTDFESYNHGATHFYDPRKVKPKWAKKLTKVYEHGKHVFLQ